jgi:hypothetical protein
MVWLIFLAGILNLFLGILVLYKNRGIKNVYFSLFTFSATILIFIDFSFRFWPTLFILQSAYAFALVSTFALLWILFQTKVN